MIDPSEQGGYKPKEKKKYPRGFRERYTASPPPPNLFPFHDFARRNIGALDFLPQYSPGIEQSVPPILRPAWRLGKRILEPPELPVVYQPYQTLRDWVAPFRDWAERNLSTLRRYNYFLPEIAPFRDWAERNLSATYPPPRIPNIDWRFVGPPPVGIRPPLRVPPRSARAVPMLSTQGEFPPPYMFIPRDYGFSGEIPW